MKMDYVMLLQILTEAEQRVATSEFEDVRNRSQETIDLCLEKLRDARITSVELLALAEAAKATGSNP